MAFLRRGTSRLEERSKHDAANSWVCGGYKKSKAGILALLEALPAPVVALRVCDVR